MEIELNEILKESMFNKMKTNQVGKRSHYEIVTENHEF